jgi:RNA polymerase sigma-70 factor (ECF subfamily)
MLLEECQECVTLETEGSDKKTVDSDILRALMNQIDSLPRRQATILKMRAIEGLEYEEIARRTGRSQVNVRVHICMARKSLKKRMKV